ncbi:MAG: hypothetical protein HGA44_07065, partial [Cellulomonadaceae bacterium]|nr:hypothetical protein [Cellulomonadaceae bacterium]
MSSESLDVVRAATRRRRLSTVGAVVVPAVIAVLAVIYPGAPVSQVDLNDGAVWLTNQAESLLGRYNPAVDELNAGLAAQGPGFDVLQDAQDVVLVEPGKVSVVDPATVTLAATTTLPAAATVSMARGVIGIAAADGSVWARTSASLAGLDVVAQAPDLALGTGGVAVVSHNGLLLGASADGTLWRGAVADGGVTVTDAGTLAGGTTTGFEQVSAVGNALVALTGTTLHMPDAATDLASFGADLLLQQPGPGAAAVLVATPTALLEVPLDGSAVREHLTGGSGTAAAPVRVGTCSHGAWATSTGSYVQLCDGKALDVVDLKTMTTSDQLVFRVNRDVVVLNDVLAGRLWVPTQDPLLREPNWQDIEPDDQTPAEDQTQDLQSNQNVQSECTAQSSPPTAADDDYGVRAGRTTILSVIDNDASSDCGILVISEFDEIPDSFGSIVSIYGGRALQITTAPGATGTVELTYTVTDGRGSSVPSTATVRLTARDATVNGAPVQVRVGQVVAEVGASATYDVLPDFLDPDGDVLVLTGATVDGDGLARVRPDGELTFTAGGESLGRQTVHLLVTDGTETVEGTLVVDVRPAGSLVPVIDPVHAVTYVNQPVTLSPLESVRSASRETVRLAGVDEQAGITITTDLTAGTFTFTAPTAGTYYVTFLVAASPQQATGVARIDVRELPEVIPPPKAVLDVALLPPGGEVTIAPLANDVDRSGAVLVLLSVSVPDGSGLRAAVLSHELVRFSSTRILDGPVTVTYVMSNGVSAIAKGEILVQPIAAASDDQAPVVPDATASVRTGGVVTIPVLDGAYDPDGGSLTIDRTLVEPLEAGQGLLFPSGDVLRFQAPEKPMTVHATFTVRDSAGNPTSAHLTVTVHASDASTKSAPRPVDLTARVFESETIRIPVPLTGIDADGDGVSLLGEDQAPAKGRIVAVGADWLEYQALPGELGTDTFTYAVEDWVGQRAVATVRVGIAERPTTSAEVISRNDDVQVRPGQQVSVLVLANDADTSGGELSLSTSLTVPVGVDARVVGRRIVVEAPTTPGVVQIQYTATNLRGGSDSAVLTLTVSDDAQIQAPVARDVVVPATTTINAVSVEVDVLEVAENPSGPLSDLAVSVDPSAEDVATVTARGTILVTLVDHPQTLPYLLTNTRPDAGGLRSYAFITVPALGDFPPVARPGAPDLVVIAGEELVIPLSEQIQVAPGRVPRVVSGSSVTATKSDGSSLVRDDATLTYTADRTYAGPASISLTVSDGQPGDPTARTRTLTLPITVLAADDHPPRFAPSVLDVPAGESTKVDLEAFTSAPVGTATGTGRYTFEKTSAAPAGFAIDLTGSVLTVTADPTVNRGTVGGVSLSIDYGGTDVLPVQVDFRVVASSRPLARVVDRVVTNGVEGETTSVSVLQDAFNPYPDSPLTLVSATLEAGAGQVSVQGSVVAARPASGFIGTMVVRFRVRDVTGDVDREVEGRLSVVVRGRPAAPTAPRIVEVRDGTVALSWDTPVANGEPITGYRVVASPGGVVTDCPANACTITGLTNDTEYTFTVTARNAVGVSDPSPSSAPARPDAKPAAPDAPSLTWGDASVTATWSAPATTGSPIDRK